MAVISHLFASHIATQHKYESQGLVLSKRHQVETSNKSRSKAALPYPRSLIDKSFEVMPNITVKSLYLMISQRRPERKVRKFPQWEKLETRLWEICHGIIAFQKSVIVVSYLYIICTSRTWQKLFCPRIFANTAHFLRVLEEVNQSVIHFSLHFYHQHILEDGDQPRV